MAAGGGIMPRQHIQSEWEIRVCRLLAQVVKMDELVFAKLAQGYMCEVY